MFGLAARAREQNRSSSQEKRSSSGPSRWVGGREKPQNHGVGAT